MRYNYFKLNKKYITSTVFLSLICSGCSLMPRMTLDSNAGDIFEYKETGGRFKVNVYPLDQRATKLNDKSKYIYHIEKYDTLSFTVWGHSEFSSPDGLSFNSPSSLSSTSSPQLERSLLQPSAATPYSYSSDQDGMIYIPLIGPLKVVGKTTTQVKTELITKLSKYVVNPQVSLQISAYRSNYVYVLGEVSQVTSIYLNDVPLNLASALTAAGWANAVNADIKNIYVIREKESNVVDIYRLDATTPTSLVLASNFVLSNKDVVYVSTAGVAQLDRVVSHLLSSASFLWQVKTTFDPAGTLTAFPSQPSSASQ